MAARDNHRFPAVPAAAVSAAAGLAPAVAADADDDADGDADAVLEPPVYCPESFD